MEYNRDKADEATLALLYLGLTRTPDGGGRAWKGFDQQILARLHQKGWIAAPRMRFGKISEMNTQMTEPWPKACAAMKTSRPTSTSTLEVELKWPTTFS